MNLLKDRVALVTGSSRGIGAAIATTFAQAGARIALHGRDEAALAAVQARIDGLGGEAISVTSWITGVIVDIAGGAVLV
jgi:3-oxoacyl-[acyl-carrier protein] reductase